MTTCTPIYGLTYAIGPDRGCDIGDAFCEFASQVEALLQGFEASLNRTTRGIPMAKVSSSVAQALSGNVTFDTEEVDTDGMVNLSASNLGITIQRTGKYVATAYSTQIDGAGVGAMDLLLNKNGFGLAEEDMRYGGSAVGNHGISVATIAARTSADPVPANWTAGDFVSLSPIGTSGTSITSLPEAEVTVYWVGDPT